jgi:hypothetical protein
VKRVTIITVVVVIATVVVWDAVEFAGGYNVFPLVVGFFPASFFLFALTSLATLAAVIVILIALFQRHIRYAGIMAGVIAASWIFSPWFLARPAFLLGLATRLHQSSSSSEIRSVAQTCLSLLPSGGPVFAPRKVMGPRPYEEEQSKRVWNAISSHAFVHLDGDTCVAFVEPPVVTFSWGRALPGHWGICVGEYHDDTGRSQTIRFAEGIILFRGD